MSGWEARLRRGDILTDETGVPWEVDLCIGAGGSGEVYKVTVVQTGAELDERIGALKLITRPSSVEARAHGPGLTLLKDAGRDAVPYFTKLYGWGVQPGSGALFFVTEYVDGRTLRELMLPGVPSPCGGPMNYLRQRPVPEADAMRIFEQILMGLDYAHHRKLVHRDLKPENVMVTGKSGDYRVKILDLGIAHLLGRGAARGDGAPTPTRYFVGSYQYAAPEQYSIPPRVGRWTDLFQVGIVLAEMLTGRHPFSNDAEDKRGRGSHLDTWQRRIVIEAPDLDRTSEGMGLSPGMRQFLSKLMGRPNGYRTVKEVWQGLGFHRGTWQRPDRDVRCPRCGLEYTYVHRDPVDVGGHSGVLVSCARCETQYVEVPTGM